MPSVHCVRLGCVEESAALSRWRPLVRIGKALVWLLVIAFVANYLARNAEEFRQFELSVDWNWTGASLVLVLSAYLSNIWIWTVISHSLEISEPWHVHARAWALSRLGRYVPGKLAAALIRIDGYAPERAQHVGIGLLIEMLTSLAAASVFVVAVGFYSSLELPPEGRLLVWLVAVLSLLTVFSPALRSVAVAVFRRFGGEMPERFPGWRKLAVLSAAQTVVVALHGLSLYCALRAFAYVQPVIILDVTVAYYFAGLIGMIALFAPAGLGVREGVLLGLLPLLAPLPVAAAAILLVRILTISAELMLSAALLAVSRPVRNS